MAEPGAAWNATDAIQKDLPFRRLRKVALSKTLCVVFYETGGFVHSYEAAAFQIAQDAAILAWAGTLSESALDPAALLGAIDQKQTGKLDHL